MGGICSKFCERIGRGELPQQPNGADARDRPSQEQELAAESSQQPLQDAAAPEYRQTPNGFDARDSPPQGQASAEELSQRPSWDLLLPHGEILVGKDPYRLTGRKQVVSDLVNMIAIEWHIDVSKLDIKLCCDKRGLRSDEPANNFDGLKVQFSTSAKGKSDTIPVLQRAMSDGNLIFLQDVIKKAEMEGIPEGELANAKAKLQELENTCPFHLLTSSTGSQ
eukprot:TRINITY_DN106674_c0_g1_i1.p1 TRINITY_DN106674_c0_g1~~TRINITY_DN106674_c0_g1_i1.p1  ORF type:complete len:222 (-),score=40.22 TRINITY_DN106674_c0_g1_i1:125-790(-)